MPLISVVSPVYRAADCVAELCAQLKAALEVITSDYEIVLVDDRSPDDSWARIEAEAARDPRVVGIRLARNFGQHYAITAGLDHTRSDWVVVLDCDLQDPPELIPELYRKAQEGYDVVVATFEERSEKPIRRHVSRLFWWLLSKMAGTDFDPRVGNYRIMSRKVVESFRLYREQLRFLGGILALMGFRTTAVSTRRNARFAGSTSYTLAKLMRVAVDTVMAYSDKPLRISVMIGFLMAAGGLLIGMGLLVMRLVNVIEVPGWTSVVASLYLIGGLIIANLGIIGYYLGRTYDETKRRPLYIVDASTKPLQ